MNQLNEFCDHCAKKHGIPNSFSGLVPPGHIAKVFCNGCGITTVDHRGHCLKCKPNFTAKIPLLIGVTCIAISTLFLIFVF